MTLMEALILVNTLALLAGVLVLARLAGRIGRATEEVGVAARRIAEITPAAGAFLENGRAQLEALRTLTKATTGVVEDVRVVSGQASAVTSQIVRGLESEVFDRYRALFAGLRAGAGVLRRFRGGNGYRESQSADMEDFDQVRE